MAAQRVRKTVRTASPSSLEKPTYSGDELWKTYSPQTLQDAWNFVGRIARIKPEIGYSDMKAVRQDLVNTVGKNLDQQQGIQEFECSLSESSDTESKDKIKEKKN